MRKVCVWITAVMALSASQALAQVPVPRLRPVSTTDGAESAVPEANEAGENGCESDGCGGGHGGRRNANRWFNCNCNGSYKFPVPPLYTYHWPGLYSMQRMTDYHSPWRFPAIKPYEDETPVRDLSRIPESRQASFKGEAVADEAPERISTKIARRYAE